MLNPWKIQSELKYEQICRRCFNEKYHTELKSNDLWYLRFEMKCKSCGKVKQPIIKFRFMGILKVLFAKDTCKKRQQQ